MQDSVYMQVTSYAESVVMKTILHDTVSRYEVNVICDVNLVLK